MRVLYTVRMRLFYAAVRPARAANKGTPHSADPCCMMCRKRVCRKRVVYTVRLEVSVWAFHAVRGCGVRVHQMRYTKQVLCASPRGLCACTPGQMRVIVVRTRMRTHYAVRMLVIPGAAVITMQSGIQRSFAHGSLCWKSTRCSSHASPREGSRVRWPSRRSSWWRRSPPSTGWTLHRCSNSSPR